MALLLTGCTTQPNNSGPSPTTATSAPPPAVKEVPQRALRMAGGLALSYVQPETAARVLCWPFAPPHPVLVRFEPDIGGRKPNCRITDARGGHAIELSLKQATSTTFAGNDKIADRDAMVNEKSGKVFVETPVSDAMNVREISPQWPILLAGADQADAALLREYLAKVLPELTKDADRLAVYPGGGVDLKSVTVTPDVFHDLAKPLQALQLCQIAKETLGLKPSRVTEGGVCVAKLPDGSDLALRPEATSRTKADYERTVGGRPASTDGRDVRVRLRDDTPLDLIVPQQHESIGEKVVAVLGQK
nr:hypothetical protein [Kibdelosporangium sp. MJ126-NF4]CEL18143.1 hypothetical protein [Kibdelosporangium sp. MJ126-NF4]CTQ90627.1 hypothetical protein [Kibdelosporangium sp. MJ126-NF4]